MSNVQIGIFRRNQPRLLKDDDHYSFIGAQIDKRRVNTKMESGGSAHDRRAEANRILEMLRAAGVEEDFTKKETEFIDNCWDPDTPISPKMLFWMRDIKDKYL